MNAVVSTNGTRIERAPKLNRTTRSLPIELDWARLDAARAAFTTRRVDLIDARFLLTDVRPEAGQVALARVRRLCHHTRLQDPHGRRVTLFPGDEIIVSFGDRYAPQQFEAYVPDTIGPCHLVASGGIAAQATSWHSRIGRGPTEIDVLGVLGDLNGMPLTLARYAIDTPLEPVRPDKVIAVAGTSMDSGKTMSAAYLVRGLARAGMRVGAAKLTGTGACNDFYQVLDAGAAHVVDFTDAGYASTFQADAEDIENINACLLNALARRNVGVAIVEIADGLLQRETAALLSSERFRASIDGIVFCAQDALGAQSGVDWLNARGHNVVAVAGKLTAAPLAVREAISVVDQPVLGLDGLADPFIAPTLLGKPYQDARSA
ncbi:MAG: DUF1611 domain-containing protein [Pseudomonadota bacterium]